MSSMYRLLPAFVLLTTAVLLPGVARAQQDPEQPDLPDIAPREVEIRGQLEISFPSLRRQPLIGFNPPPRLPEIPADRVPFVEEYKQESADLPPSPLSPPSAPRLDGLSTYPPSRVELDATAGRFFSRTIRGRAGVSLGGSESLTARLNYAGLDSYQPFQDEAPYNLFDAAIGISTSRRNITTGAEIGGFVDTYDLFGADVASSGVPVVPQPSRDGRGVEGNAWLRASSGAGAEGNLRVAFSSATFKTDAFGEPVEEGPHHRSGRYIGVDGGGEIQAGPGRIGVQGHFGRSTLDEETFANTGTLSYDAGAYVRLPVADRLQLTAGARLLGYQLDEGDQTLELAGLPEDVQEIAPDVRLEVYLAHGAMLYVHNRPALEDHHLSSLYELNPFLVSEPVVAPTVRSLELEGGGRFFVGPVQFGLRGGYRDYPSLLFFEHAATAADPGETHAGYERGFSAARYDEATVAYGGGDVSISVARGVQAALSVTGRRGRLEDDVSIPYFGSVVGSAMFSFAFNDNRGLVQLTGNYESSRYRDRAQTRQIGDYFDVDLMGSYMVTPALKVLLAVDNMSADHLERYDGYPLPAFVIRAGLGVRW